MHYFLFWKPKLICWLICSFAGFCSSCHLVWLLVSTWLQCVNGCVFSKDKIIGMLFLLINNFASKTSHSPFFFFCQKCMYMCLQISLPFRQHTWNFLFPIINQFSVKTGYLSLSPSLPFFLSNHVLVSICTRLHINCQEIHLLVKNHRKGNK